MDPRIPRLRRKLAAIPFQPLRSHSFGEEQHEFRLGAVRPIMVLVRPFSKCRGRKAHGVLPGVCATPGET